MYFGRHDANVKKRILHNMSRIELNTQLCNHLYLKYIFNF